MASEKIVSPGVFTQEKDLSYLPRGLSEIGALVIGRTPKGPAFKPITVNSFDEFKTNFGEKELEYTVPYMADEYLKNSGVLTTVRVLGNEAFSYTTALEISSGSTLLAVIRPTASASGDIFGWVTSSFAAADFSVSMSCFDLILSESAGASTYTSMSLSPTSANFIGKVIGTDPKGTGRFYVDHVYYNKISQSMYTYNGLILTGSIASTTSAVITTTGEYITPQSPIVISQTFGTSTNHQLFNFYTLGDGQAHNQDVKISIFNVKESGSVAGSNYGSFGIAVRDYSDTDKTPNILETFTDLNLDPNSANYIARRIGDQTSTTDSNGKIVTTGDYPNISKYVRVAMKNLSSVPNDALPFGFTGYYKYNSNAPDIEYKTSQSIDGAFNERSYFGIDFKSVDVANYHTFLPNNKASMSADFLLSNCISYNTGSNTWTGANLSVSSSVNEKQFSFGFQLGFDGVDPRKVVGAQMTCTTATISGSVAYVKAIDSAKNPDEYDFNMVVIPELNYRENPYVLQYALDVCEDRGDAFLIMDLGPKTDNITTVLNTAKTIDSSYAASYYPWVKLFDTANNKLVWMPPTVVLPGVIAYTDKVAHEWYAPAGSNRGGLTSVVQTYERLNRTDKDNLYAGRINPIATFPDTGVVVWGQKTLQAKASALDRINVRRLLIKIKKMVASASRYLVFEQNNEQTWDLFKSIVNPMLDNITVNSGLYAYKVVMDSTSNTPSLIDRGIMKGSIFLQPTRSSEFILLDFNIMPTGASFGS